jgi:phosphatidylinositol-3-phosphatase
MRASPHDLMLRRLHASRLSWTQVAIVAAASALSTAVIIDVNTSGDGLPYSTLAALRQRVAVHTPPASTVAPVTTAAAPPAAPVDTSAVSAAASTLADAPNDSSVPVDTVEDASGTTGEDGAGDDGTGSDTTGTTGTLGASSSTSPSARADHVFVIALTTPSYRAAFGPGSVAHYLNHTLRRKGLLLDGYRTLGGSELPDYLAMVSGQAPNADTRGDCSTYAEFTGSAQAASDGQVPGAGCVYPNTVLTVADQVTAAGKQWKAYLADMGDSTCVHPNSNAAGDGELPGADSNYDTQHNPFVYFHSLLDLGGCSSNDVGLQHLTKDLRADKRTPTYAFIAPGLCDEPSAGPCPDGSPGGLAGEEAFLKRLVPVILASPAYRQGGVLMVVFAKAPAATGSGPVRTGALILSPKVKAGSTVSTRYGPYSVLRSVEDLLGLTALVHAQTAKSFASLALGGA